MTIYTSEYVRGGPRNSKARVSTQDGSVTLEVTHHTGDVAWIEMTPDAVRRLIRSLAIAVDRAELQLL